MFVTARNTPGSHNNSATVPFSETGMCNYATRYRLCDFRNLCTGACGVVVAVIVHRMNFFFVNSIFNHNSRSNIIE